jgi:antitoxin (DNA-binding transcriptional repressor) of toxin-antitoxin stability system
MKVSGVREFRNHVPEYVKSNDLVFVTRHGRVSSVLVPLEGAQSLPLDLRRELLERLGEAVSHHLKKSGVGEGKVLRDFKLWRVRHRARRGGR